MIGLDTNILVGYVTQDEAAQVRRVDAVIERAESDGVPLLIDDIVLCEMVWVLGTGYRYDKAAIAAVLDQILSTAVFSFEDRDLLRRALDAYLSGSADFADYVIGLRNARAGCTHTVTLDRALRGDRRFVLL